MSKKEIMQMYQAKARMLAFLLNVSSSNLEDAKFWNSVVVPKIEELSVLNQDLKRLGLEKREWFEHPVLAEAILKNASKYYFLGQLFFSIDQQVLAIKCLKRSLALYSYSVVPQDAFYIRDLLEYTVNYYLSDRKLKEEQIRWAKVEIKDSINYWYINAYVRFLDLYTEKLGFYDSFLSPNIIYSIGQEAKNYAKRFRS